MASVQQTINKKFIDHYKKAINKALDVQCNKQQTYNGDSVTYKDYISIDNFYFAQMWNKILRIKSIMSGSKVNYESLEDSLIDLINYTAFCYAEIKTKEEEKHA